MVDKSILDGLEDGLAVVMHRFRDSFLGEGIHLSGDKVPLRERADFATPLVTVLGHTYGLRLAAAPNESLPAVEASVNVYDDEFQLGRFKDVLSDIYEWSRVSRIIANFATPADELALGKDPKRIQSLFHLDIDTGVEVVEKEKKTASVVTGRFVDRILHVRYGLETSQLERLRDRDLFVSGVYLYCLRPFAAAYRKSLTTSPIGGP